MANQKIKNRDNYGIVAQNSNLAYNSYNYDLLMTISKLLNTGNVDEALELLSNLSKSISGHHPLYPYYSTEIENRDGKLVFISKSNSKEATEKYPQKYKGKVEIPEEYKNFSSIYELSNYANRNQIHIDMNVLEFEKFLGDSLDPYQDYYLSDKKIGKPILRIIPKEFPPAKPFKIIFSKSNFSLDYILLRIEKITDDNEMIFSNKEQDIGLYISFITNLDHSKSNLYINTRKKYKKDVSTNLAFINVIKCIGDGEELQIISLEDGKTLLSGFLKEDNKIKSHENEDKERILFENLKIIEDFYSIKIEISDQIMMIDATNAEILAKGIKGEKIVGKYNYIDTDFKIIEESKESIRGFHDNIFMMSYEIYDYEVKIFNHSFKVPKVIQTLKKVKMAEGEKVLRKLDVLEEGDMIKIKFIPADEESIEHSDEFYFE